MYLFLRDLTPFIYNYNIIFPFFGNFRHDKHECMLTCTLAGSPNGAKIIINKEKIRIYANLNLFRLKPKENSAEKNGAFILYF